MSESFAFPGTASVHYYFDGVRLVWYGMVFRFTLLWPGSGLSVRIGSVGELGASQFCRGTVFSNR